jgi:hypothetical protein
MDAHLARGPKSIKIDQNRLVMIAFGVHRLGGLGSHSNPLSSVRGVDRHLGLRSTVNSCSRTTVGS